MGSQIIENIKPPIMTGNEKANKAGQWHLDNGIICNNCKHFQSIPGFEKSGAIVITYCDLHPIGRGRWYYESCSSWEAKDDAETGLRDRGVYSADDETRGDPVVRQKRADHACKPDGRSLSSGRKPILKNRGKIQAEVRP